MGRAELVDQGGREYAGVGDHLLTGLRGHPIASPADCCLRLSFPSPTDASVPVRLCVLDEINTLVELILVYDSRKRILAIAIETCHVDIGKGDKLEQLQCHGTHAVLPNIVPVKWFCRDAIGRLDPGCRIVDCRKA